LGRLRRQNARTTPAEMSAVPAPFTIRRAAPADAPALARLYAEPEVQASLLQMPYPSEEALRTWLAEQQQRGRADIHLVAEREGELVALAGLDPVSVQVRRRHAMGLGMAVARAAQGRGIGKALMQALTDYADRWAQVLRIELQVYVDNAAAIALYRGFGFRVEGTLRGYALRDGVYADVYAMARLHPNAPALAWPAADDGH
jgi:putative acetyltransferase